MTEVAAGGGAVVGALVVVIVQHLLGGGRREVIDAVARAEIRDMRRWLEDHRVAVAELRREIAGIREMLGRIEAVLSRDSAPPAPPSPPPPSTQ